MSSNRPIDNPYSRSVCRNVRRILFPRNGSSEGAASDRLSSAALPSLPHDDDDDDHAGSDDDSAPNANRAINVVDAANVGSPNLGTNLTTPVMPGYESPFEDISGNCFGQVPADVGYVDLVATPTTKSPTKDAIRADLDGNRAKRRNDASVMLSARSKANRRAKYRYSPKSQILTFLRDEMVNDRGGCFFCHWDSKPWKLYGVNHEQVDCA